jgi:hypothetical protein
MLGVCAQGPVNLPATPLTLVRLILDLVLAVGYAWFWVHCARPMLVWRQAGPWTYRLVLWVTTFTVATWVGEFLAQLARMRFAFGMASWWAAVVVGTLWLAIVGIGYLNQYRILMRLMGGR